MSPTAGGRSMLKYLRARVVATIGFMVLVAGARAQSAGQVFKSPLKNFTVLVPDFVFGTKVVKQSDKNGGGLVLFWGKDGEWQRIDYFKIPEHSPVPADSTERYAYFHKLLDALLHDHDARILTERGETLDGIMMLNALIVFTAESHLSVSHNGQPAKRLDSTRGILVFARETFIYILQDEVGAPIFNQGDEVPTTEQLGRRSDEYLPKFYRSITFL